MDVQTAHGFTTEEVEQFFAILVAMAVSYWWFLSGWENWRRRRFLRRMQGKSFTLSVCEP